MAFGIRRSRHRGCSREPGDERRPTGIAAASAVDLVDVVVSADSAAWGAVGVLGAVPSALAEDPCGSS
jgi:hypothetical protein